MQQVGREKDLLTCRMNDVRTIAIVVFSFNESRNTLCAALCCINYFLALGKTAAVGLALYGIIGHIVIVNRRCSRIWRPCS